MHQPLLLLLATFVIAVIASAQPVNWVQFIDPTDKDDVADGVCLFGDYLAVVGDADDRYFVALLNRITGEVVKTYVGKDGWLHNCLSIGDSLYVVGYDVIYVFDKGLNVLKRVETNWDLNAISFDGSYLYLAGYIWRDVDGDGNNEHIWRIEKRTLDLDLVAYRELYKEFKVYKEWERARKNAHRYLRANNIAVNPATGELWAVGHGGLSDKQMSFHYSLLVILDRGLNVKTVVEYPWGHENYLDGLNGICFDDEGNAYVVGGDGVAKFDKNGNIMAVNRNVGGYKIACVGGRVYVFDNKRVGGYWRHVLYVFDEKLNLLGELILSEGVEANSFFDHIGGPAFDGKNLYVAGYGGALGEDNIKIVVYSISLSFPVVQPSPTTMPLPPQLTTTPAMIPPRQASSPPTPPSAQSSTTDFLPVGAFVAAVIAVAGLLAVARLRGRSAEVRKAPPPTVTTSQQRVSEADVVGDFCLEYQGGVIPLAAYTVIGRRDFSGLPERVLEMIDERHFAVYFRDGVWWVEDLGSRYGTYLNGVKVKRERLREGDVVSPGAAVAVMFKRCGTTRRVVPMEEEGTKTY